MEVSEEGEKGFSCGGFLKKEGEKSISCGSRFDEIRVYSKDSLEVV